MNKNKQWFAKANHNNTETIDNFDSLFCKHNYRKELNAETKMCKYVNNENISRAKEEGSKLNPNKYNVSE